MVSLHMDGEMTVLSGILKGVLSHKDFLESDFKNSKSKEVFNAIIHESAFGRPTFEGIEKYLGIEKSKQINLDEPANKIIDCANALRRENYIRQILDLSRKIPKSTNPENELKELTDSIRSYYSVGKTSRLLTAKEALNKLENQADLDQGVLFGIKSLDTWTKGMHEGELTILAARPSVGKTSLALQIALEASSNSRVAFFNLEMSTKELMKRALCYFTKKNYDEIKKKIPEETKERINNLGLLISDSSNQTISSILEAAKQAKECGGLDLIIVDYLQLVRPQKKNKNRNEEVEEISRDAKLMARELKVPVLMLSQLSRDIEKRTDRRPILSDLRGSGAIEQDADKVIFIHEEDGQHEIILSKQRNGPVGDIKISFDKYCYSFTEQNNIPF